MNREEAIKIFSGIASLAKINTEPTMSVCNVKNEVFVEVYQCLLSHQPDPITGLVPCQCCNGNHESSKRCLEWVETTERLPVKEDAGIDDFIAFCYRDEWDCFNRLEKWDEISPQKHTYWHRMLKAPEVEG